MNRVTANPSEASPAAPSRLARRLDWLSILLLAGLALGFMWRVTARGDFLLPLDVLFQVEPWRSEAAQKPTDPIWNPVVTDIIWLFYPSLDYAHEAWQHGVPLWDPNIMNGVPALARGEMFSNPIFQLLRLGMSTGAALSWGAVVCLFLGELFTFLLLRELGLKQAGAIVGALAFAFNGYAIGWLFTPFMYASMIWTPLVFWGVLRALNRQDWRWALLGSAGFAMQVWAGNSLLSFYTAMLLGLCTLIRSAGDWRKAGNWRAGLRPLLFSAIALGGGFALAAPQFLLTLELFFQTTRTAKLGASSSLPLNRLIRLLAPGFDGNPLHGNTYAGPFNYTETNIYFGLAGLVFMAASLFSPRRRLAAWALGLGGATFLAVYNVFPLRQIVAFVFPLFLNTFPGRIFVIPVFLGAVMAGIGADWLIEFRPGRVLRRLGLACAVALALLLGLTGWYWRPWAVAPEAHSVLALRVASLAIGCVWLALTAAWLWGWSRGRLGQWSAAGAALVLVAADLMLANWDYNPSFPAAMAYPEAASLTTLQDLKASDPQPFRTINIPSDSLMPALTAELLRVPVVSAYTTWLPRRYSEYVSLTRYRSTVNPVVYAYFNDCCDPLLDALNVKYVYAAAGVVPDGVTASIDLTRQFSGGQAQVTGTGDVHLARWAIEDVEQTILYQHPPASVSFDIPVSHSGTFNSAISINPDAWSMSGDGVNFALCVAVEGAAEAECPWSQYIDPKHNPNERGWIPVEVDLEKYAGHTIRLTLTTDPGPNGDLAFDWAGWVEPRLITSQPPNLELIYNGPNKIYENKAALPRAWVVHEVTEVPPEDLAAAAARLTAFDFDPASEAVVEGQVPGALGKPAAGDSVRVAAYAAEQVQIEATLAEPGVLVLSDLYYPGWRVYVDDVEAPILATNLAMRGVYLTGGRHEVRFEYRPPLFYAGLGLAGGTLALAGAAWALTNRRRAHPTAA